MTGRELQAWRDQRGYSQMFLASLLGVTQAAVSFWEADKRPIERTVELALCALGAPEGVLRDVFTGRTILEAYGYTEADGTLTRCPCHRDGGVFRMGDLPEIRCRTCGRHIRFLRTTERDWPEHEPSKRSSMAY